MRFEQVPTNVHHRVFAEWSKSSRLEERTCRPIVNGERISRDNASVTWSFFVDELEEIAGRFHYFDLNSRNRSAEFGYMVNPKFRRQKIGTKMLNLGISRLFSTTDLNKLYCQTAEFNIPSIKLLEKLKFHRDGVLREHHELDGKLYDDYVYSILRREWREVAI
jgi:[ribosomal protein S5]-alanine N-acetyltransferase